MIGKAIGSGFAWARDNVAKGLIRARVHPNAITIFGTVVMLGVGVLLAASVAASTAWDGSDTRRPGANLWLYLAAAGMVVSLACDMLDGSVARLGGLKSKFGAFLDSSLDRFSDFAVFAGIAAGCAFQGNVTFTVLAMLGFFNGFLISYTRARAEDLIDSCNVGYWQRPERQAAVLVAAFAGNLPGMILQQATLPMLTVFRRIGYTRNVLAGREPITDPRQGGLWLKIRLWRWPRMTVAYDLVTGLNIAWLIFGRIPPVDIVEHWLG
jgi:CDP-diacylglycerol--glycerol-3-phosphate 3-phosphatidyltransferase